MESSFNRIPHTHALTYAATASALVLLLPLMTACTDGKHAGQPAPSPAPAITSFKAFPSPIRKNDTVILNATFTNGKGMVEPGGVPVSSGEPIKLKPDKDTTYTITVTNSAGVTVAREAKVAVLPTGTPILSLITEVPSLSDTPAGIAVDASGNLYLSNPQTGVISTITAAGEARTVAGKSLELSDNDGPGEVARFRKPCNLATDGTGNLYVEDVGNGTIRKITPQGEVRTLAGVALEPSTIPGTELPGTEREDRFKRPWGLAVGADGNVYIGDTLEHTIRKVMPDGFVITFAGSTNKRGSTDGPRNTARFDQPEGIAVDSLGNLWVADRVSHTVRKITPAGDVSTIAGKAGTPGSADGVGINATFDRPTSVAVDKEGNLYVADSGNSTIRKITTTGVVSTIAGVPGNHATQLGALPGLLNNPRYITVDPITGDLLVSQPGSILKVSF